MTSKAQQQAWRDWGAVNPLYGVLTDPRYRHGGDIEEFYGSGEATIAVVLANVAEAGISLQHDSALEFGCGIGRLTFPLGRRFRTVVGLDASTTMLARAVELHPPAGNVEFLLNETDDLGRFSDSSFDLVLSMLVLQHLDSVQAVEGFLREFVRVVRPGGAVVVQLPTSVPTYRPPKPPWNTRSGLRTRSAIYLRRIGVSPHFLYRRLDWVPEMTLLALSEERVHEVIEGAGGKVVHVSPPVVDAGGTRHLTYFATR
jgi:ubiquinone/menaquinone biosynthesis C-methylase UbiE